MECLGKQYKQTNIIYRAFHHEELLLFWESWLNEHEQVGL
jgi:hypothetical protein